MTNECHCFKAVVVRSTPTAFCVRKLNFILEDNSLNRRCGSKMSNNISPEKTVEELRAIFKPFDVHANPEKYKLKYPDILKKSSVLIPLLYKNGEYNIILTVRSKQLTHHAGYVALPGGVKDDDDVDEIQTALREAEEEIGLSPLNVDVIGVFSPGIVKPNYLVYPVIGLLKSSFKPVINEKEVSFVFELPLKRFLSTEGRRISDFRSLSPIKATYHVHHFVDKIDGEEVDTWGFTATICVMTAIAVYQTDDTFCFYEHFTVHRGNLFSSDGTQHIIQHMLKLANL